ncbi:MAG: PEP-CTERM sorting domain-containing protein, partial [Betaproteobacteria bacterium]|nr:PEP-CTERM sorting domain-containing protein [Betaproteobacteria bacterium]
DGPVKLYGGAGISGHLFATDFEIGSGSTLYGTHALHGDFRWTTGSLKSAGTTTVGGDATLTITGGNDHDMDQRRLVNDGTVVWEGGSIRGGGGSGIENNGLWLDQLAGNAEFNRAYGGANGGWVNNGTYRKTTGVITTFNQSLSNRNLIEVQAGVLRLSGNTVHETGSLIQVAAGAMLEIRSTHTFQDGVTLEGPVKVLGTANVEGNLTAMAFELAGGVLGGSHTLHGNYLWTTGTLNGAGTTVIADALFTIAGAGDHDLDRRTLVNDGTVVWEGGNIRGGSGTTVVNNGEWLDRVSGNSEFNRAYGGADGEWVNNGTYLKTGGAITTFAHTLRNRGVFEVDAGVLRLAGNTTHEAGSRMEAAAGALLEIHSTHTFEDGVTLDGAVKLLGTANVTGHLTATAFDIAGGVLGGSHTLHGSYRWSAGTLNGAGVTRVAADGVFMIAGGGNHDLDRRVLVNEGTVDWQAGAIRGGGGSRIENAGLWLDQTTGVSDIDRAYGGSGGNFVNGGTYLKSGAGTTRITGHAFDNTGVVNVQAGRLELLGGVTQIAGSMLTGGTWHVGANSAIVVAGAPIVTVNGGSVWMEGAGSSFAPIDGLADNRGTFRITGGRNFTTMGNLVNSGQIFVGAGSSLQVLGQLESDGAIGGGGRISVSNMRARGRIAPGASPGELTIQGDLALEDGAALEIEIAGLAAGTEYDVLRVTGALSLDGTLDVKLLSNFAGLASGTFAFISAESVLGTFDGIADGDRVFTADGSGWFLIDYTSDAVYLSDYTATAAVPEPGTWGLLITGLGMMAGLVRRRRR